MKLMFYNSINQFIDDVMDFLIQNEIQNNIIIDNCIRGKNGADTTKWVMAAVKDAKGTLQLVALMTPPHNLVIYEVNNIPNNVAIALLTHEFANAQIKIPGLIAEKSLARRFAENYSSVSGKMIKNGNKMRIYMLEKVNDISFSPGKLRIASRNDMYYLPYWNIAITTDCGICVIDVPNAAKQVSKSINDENIYIWEDDIPVSQAVIGRRTLNGTVINEVYTPPYYREKGYATSCVANLSHNLLNTGNKFCCLFADLSNPISNHIYKKIGYISLCDFDEYRFVEISE